MHYTRITELLGLAETFWDHLVQPVEQGHLKQLSQAESSQVFNICEDGDSTTAQGNLCQCLATVTVKKLFLMFKQN